MYLTALSGEEPVEVLSKSLRIKEPSERGTVINWLNKYDSSGTLVLSWLQRSNSASLVLCASDFFGPVLACYWTMLAFINEKIAFEVF